jgi:hypothetical protein
MVGRFDHVAARTPAMAALRGAASVLGVVCLFVWLALDAVQLAAPLSGTARASRGTRAGVDAAVQGTWEAGVLGGALCAWGAALLAVALRGLLAVWVVHMWVCCCIVVGAVRAAGAHSRCYTWARAGATVLLAGGAAACSAVHWAGPTPGAWCVWATCGAACLSAAVLDTPSTLPGDMSRRFVLSACAGGIVGAWVLHPSTAPGDSLLVAAQAVTWWAWGASLPPPPRQARALPQTHVVVNRIAGLRAGGYQFAAGQG